MDLAALAVAASVEAEPEEAGRCIENIIERSIQRCSFLGYLRYILLIFIHSL